MKPFTLDGYKDLEELAEELYSHGTLYARTPGEEKGVVAAVVKTLLDKLTPGSRAAQERELFMACHGIVSSAIEDELL
jgi:hypothetical protein